MYLLDIILNKVQKERLLTILLCVYSKTIKMMKKIVHNIPPFFPQNTKSTSTTMYSFEDHEAHSK